METITIESTAYKQLVKKIERIAEYIAQKEALEKNPDQEIWMDSLEVSDMLRISIRTLQRLRNEKLINFSLRRGKCVYRLKDIEDAVNNRIINCPPRSLEEYRINYLLNGK